MTRLTDNGIDNIQLVQKIAASQFPDEPVLQQLTTCQAILESNLFGIPSELAMRYCNLFGIKGEGTNGTVGLQTKEVEDGNTNNVNADFACNNSVEDSVAQYVHLLEHGVSWNHGQYDRVLEAPSFIAATKALVVCGYATDPEYSDKLMNIYNKVYSN